MSRTRIVGTIGPNSLNDGSLRELRDAGLNIARLNGSHANLDWHRNAIARIHDVLPDTPILLDIPGRKIRTTMLRHEPTFEVGDPIIFTADLDHDGREKVPVNYDNLHADLRAGHSILADDGTLRFTVTAIVGRDVQCRAETAGKLGSRKGINVPYVAMSTPRVTGRDREMVAFACENNVDFVGLSFVESAADVEAFRALIGAGSPRIVAKIENQGGLDHAQAIVEAADAIMIDRGDLSVETSLYDVAIKQKFIIETARRHGRPVIVATEMLHTMIQNAVPTKAEVSDITNAVLDGCAATMLSGETAVGAFAVEAVRTMRRVIDAAEAHYDAESARAGAPVGVTVPDVISQVIPTICRSLPITKIVAVTRSGFAARMIAVHRLKAPILAVSDDAAAARSFNLIAGTTGVLSDVPFARISADHMMHVLKMLWKRRHIVNEDLVLVTGISYPTAGSRMNTIQIYAIDSLAKTFDWT